jgi:hypothetical protein
MPYGQAEGEGALMRRTSVAAATAAAALSLMVPLSAYAADAPAPQASTVPAAQHSIDPKVSFAKSCSTGITVILSNIAPDDSTTDPVTFHVTAPSGRTSDVVVQPNQLVKLVYAVREGATANVGVDTPGLPHQAFSWTKRCTHVLGEKVTRTPTATPAASQLPFTGVPALPLTALGVALLALGGLCQRAGRRPVRRG